MEQEVDTQFNDKVMDSASNAHNSFIEAAKGVYQYGNAALKALFLMSGGASIAVLSFWGNMVSQETMNSSIAKNLSYSVLLYGIAIVCAVLATAAAFLGQNYFALAEKQEYNIWHNLLYYNKDVPDRNSKIQCDRDRYYKKNVFWATASIIASIISCFMFLFGVYFAYRALMSFPNLH